MSSIKKPTKSREKVCKEFGELMALVCFLFDVVLIYQGKDASLILVLVGSFFLLSAIASPLVLSPLERLWMGFAEKLSVVMTYFILCLSFYLIITPTGFLYRLFNRNPMGLKVDKQAKSYFIKVDKENGPGTRFFTPY